MSEGKQGKCPACGEAGCFDHALRTAKRLRLVKALAYEFVRFNYDRRQVYLVTNVTDDCMLELEGMAGQFSPDLFQRVSDVPEHITMEIVEPAQPADVVPERIWAVVQEGATGPNISAYHFDPRTVHDNGKPVYVYRLEPDRANDPPQPVEAAGVPEQ